MANGYINPAELLKSYFGPASAKSIPLIPAYMQNKRAQKQLAQRQTEFEALAPTRAADLQARQNQNLRAEEARRQYQKLWGKQGEPLPLGTDPNQLLASPIARAYLGLPSAGLQRSTQQRIDPQTKRQYARDYVFDPETGQQRPIGEGDRLTGIPGPAESTGTYRVEYWDKDGNKFFERVPADGLRAVQEDLLTQGFSLYDPRSRTGTGALSPSQEKVQLELQLYKKWMAGGSLNEAEQAFIGQDENYINEAMKNILYFELLQKDPDTAAESLYNYVQALKRKFRPPGFMPDLRRSPIQPGTEAFKGVPPDMRQELVERPQGTRVPMSTEPQQDIQLSPPEVGGNIQHWYDKARQTHTPEQIQQYLDQLGL